MIRKYGVKRDLKRQAKEAGRRLLALSRGVDRKNYAADGQELPPPPKE